MHNDNKYVIGIVRERVRALAISACSVHGFNIYFTLLFIYTFILFFFHRREYFQIRRRRAYSLTRRSVREFVRKRGWEGEKGKRREGDILKADSRSYATMLTIGLTTPQKIEYLKNKLKTFLYLTIQDVFKMYLVLDKYIITIIPRSLRASCGLVASVC